MENMKGRLRNVTGGLGIPVEVQDGFVLEVIESFIPIFVDNEDFYNAALVVAARIQNIPTQEQVENELVAIANLEGKTEAD